MVALPLPLTAPNRRTSSVPASGRALGDRAPYDGESTTDTAFSSTSPSPYTPLPPPPGLLLLHIVGANSWVDWFTALYPRLCLLTLSTEGCFIVHPRPYDIPSHLSSIPPVAPHPLAVNLLPCSSCTIRFLLATARVLLPLTATSCLASASI